MNESYSGLFGEISSGYEECKADTVALFLSVYDEVMETLLPGKTYDQKNQVLETVWLEMVLTGLKGLRCYDANNQ
jgi:dipeptidyl-peptidase-3